MKKTIKETKKVVVKKEVVKATTVEELIGAGVVVEKHSPKMHPNVQKAFNNAGMFL